MDPPSEKFENTSLHVRYKISLPNNNTLYKHKWLYLSLLNNGL